MKHWVLKDLRTLESAQSSIEAVIGRLKLDAKLQAVSSADKASATYDISAGDISVEVTPQNRELLTGPLELEVVLVNASAKAPSILRTLNGSYSFTSGVATVCVLGCRSYPISATRLVGCLSAFGGETLGTGG